MKKPPIAFFLSHPVQYISPLLKALNNEFDVHAFYFSDLSIKGMMDKGFGQEIKWDIPLLEGYKSVFLKNYSRSKTLSNRFFELINPGLFRAILKEPSKIIVVNGWSYFSVIATIIFAKIVGKKVWLRAENPLHHELKKSQKTIRIKRLFLQYGLFKLVDKFLYIGSKNKAFFKFYGVKDDRLVYTPYSVDNAFFSNQYEAFKHHKNELMQELGLPPGKKIILFTAKYIDQKRPLDLLQAFKNLHYKNALLVLVGEGVLRKEMENYISEHALENVVLTGFVNQSLISKYYAVADVFVMCSGIPETWGLSVNEAMNFHLPVIVSKTCGCSYDLVKEEQNGYTFEEADIDSLSGKLDEILMDENFQTNAGMLSGEIVKAFSYETIVRNMYAAATGKTFIHKDQKILNKA